MTALSMAALKRQLTALADEYSGLSPQVAAVIAADALEAIETAESKLEAVEAEVMSWHAYETHDIGGAFHETVRDLVLDILTAAPPVQS